MAATRFANLPAEVRDIIAKSEADGIPFCARTAYTHRTWARTFSSLPELFIQPESLEEIEKVVSLARQCRRRIVTVGSGHSPSDLTCTSSWMINLDRYNRVLSIDKETGICVLQAGIRLFQLSAALEAAGLAMPSLGSINEQSIAGAISTGTHGSSLRHGLVSESIVALKITLADGRTVSCSADERPDLFRAALLSVGALGIITEVTFRAVPAFSLAWETTIDSDSRILNTWDTSLWTQSEFVRVWWFPYTRRAVVWKADVVPSEDLAGGVIKYYDPPTSFQDSRLGYHIYHNLLALARWFPRITPWIEWLFTGLQYSFRNGPTKLVRGVQPSHKAFLMNCLYSQHVNEWAIPLHKGPEALRRLAAWLNRLQPGDPGYVDHGIPFSAEGLYVHAPIEVRAADSTVHTSAERGNRPFLDITPVNGPALYINATMYRPYFRDPPGDTVERYYKAFEWLMRDLGGKPHWAKTFTVAPSEFAQWFGKDWEDFIRVRNEVDPQGMFVGPWHRRYLLGQEDQKGKLELEELGFEKENAKGGGYTVFGRQN
ncbi:D-arabinono-1,4-lactone oxidase-like protein [Thermochaetoides thermophila DSM 1495]|uniref:D-arabinono-1,4-lactone oxidase n=1 Tax=Chaetomium thermophilum (strain DSM 1495 / CBS 144.50 / IMI 039719) TaxID=759272 RepID=G0S1N8_CHATD|nr:D-arabinono-1,4-lactone oxidase-like protein [Thermochaetoides thermophila DSM 1495]EGS22948.1 D-arabinono-1,4-lactone oxidase-like protein [Thermochaetoides thermophila DSM 1495]